MRHLLRGRPVPEGFPGEKALFRHASFADFLDHFGAATRLLRRPEDLVWLLERHLGKLARQGALYAEVRVSPTIWERRGLDPRRTLGFLCDRVGRTAIPFRLIVDAVRHWSRESLERDLDLALEFRDRGTVALGLGGDETAAPASLFRDLAQACRSHRLPVVPHAGEALGPGEVLSALEVFRPSRIGHGIRAADDPAALAACARAGVHLEVCPTSNRKTGAYRRGLAAACRRLRDAGVAFSVNTDDPGLFAASLTAEWRWACRTLGLGRAELVRMRVLAARATFLPPREKRALESALGG